MNETRRQQTAPGMNSVSRHAQFVLFHFSFQRSTQVALPKPSRLIAPKRAEKYAWWCPTNGILYACDANWRGCDAPMPISCISPSPQVPHPRVRRRLQPTGTVHSRMIVRRRSLWPGDREQKGTLLQSFDIVFQTAFQGQNVSRSNLGGMAVGEMHSNLSLNPVD